MDKFEFDPNKSYANLKKHGIDFHEAQRIWDDPYFYEGQLTSGVEQRYSVTGYIADKCWSAVVTYRGRNIRIISVRRARTVEVKHYENHKRQRT